MIPAQEWWNIIGNYGNTIFPLQFIIYIITIILVALLYIKSDELISRILKVYFTLCFGWIGIGFFLVIAQGLPMKEMQVFLFVTITALFAYETIINNWKISVYEEKAKKYLQMGFITLILLYPVVGILFGHYYPEMILPGTYPCPTTALALVLLIPSLKEFDKLNKLLFGLLLFWAIPFPIFIQIPQFGVIEDGIMLISGIYCLTTIICGIRIKQEK